MRISYRWLNELVPLGLSVEELAQRLTMLGLEIESIERPGEGISQVFVGRILDIQPHPDAAKLVVCQTDVGRADALQIVCGATNMRVGDLVPTAVEGATLPGELKIGRRKMRGIESQGMMCSARELGLGHDHLGLLILPQDMPVGTDAVPLLGLDDVILEIEVTPNRGDWAGMIGIARELSAALNAPLIMPPAVLNETQQPVSNLASVTIEEPELCPRYTGRVLTEVTIAPSPIWMVQRLIHAGQRPINNIVDVTNYILLETGHPLHAFDFSKLLENKVVVRCAKHGETIRTIDEQIRTLTEQDLVIADGRNPIAIAGIMGGYDSEVGETTTAIFLESACFLPKTIRRTSRALGLQTESSTRFQRGADPEMARFAIDRAARLIQELAGASIARGILDEYPGESSPLEVRLRYDRTNRLLGSDISPDIQRGILRKLAFDVAEDTGADCVARVPSWRHDVTQEADLIEEIARLHGYERIPVKIPRVRRTGQVFAPQEASLRRLRNFLAGLGLTEMMNLSFGACADLQKADLEPAIPGMVLLQNPLSENHAIMRASLIPGMLSATSRNIRRGVTTIRAFEVGSIYVPDRENLPRQITRLCVVLSGSRNAKHWSAEEAQVDFYDIKGIAEAALDSLHVDFQFLAGEFGPLEPGLTARISVAGEVIGYMGGVRRAVLSRFDVEQDVFLLDIDLETVLIAGRKEKYFEAPSAFPPSLRDMAVVLDIAVPSNEISAVARQAGGNLLRDVSIFDVYTGKQVPAGKKSLALSFVFQATDRTLTEKDTQRSWDRILASLQEQFGAELR